MADTPGQNFRVNSPDWGSDWVLTPDNSQLSGPTHRLESLDFHSQDFAINCTDQKAALRPSELPSDVAELVRDSLAENTRRAYASDLAHFEKWGGVIPATDRQVAGYLAAHADELSVATLTRRIASIAKAHKARGAPSPTSAEIVKATLRGIRRRKGVAQRQATPLLRDDLFQVLATMGDRMKDARDRALLLLGFATALRRAELVALDCADLERVRQGLVVHVRRSKTDQDGEGRKIGVPLGRSRWCPVAAVEKWLARSGIKEGPIFRPVNRHGVVPRERLSGEAVCRVVAERAARAGLLGDYTAHALRAGLVTSAAQAGVPSWRIRQTTGHASDATLGLYIRSAELFVDNAAGAVL